MNRKLKLFLSTITVTSFASAMANIDDLDVRSGKNKSKADHSYKTEKDAKAKKEAKSEKKEKAKHK